ncbi:MAG: autotransporter outer membrane beta-barrel domain-containing protein [Desulfocapsaceae bacterium]|nr:autotransporter outer membrane beta-barrel domain-containing protein [Desulfocapsaceae bacterium]
MKTQTLVRAAKHAAAYFLGGGMLYGGMAQAACQDLTTGAFATAAGDVCSAMQGTYSNATANGGIVSATGSGSLTVGTTDVSVTNTQSDPNAANGFARGIFASGSGSNITLNNATVRSTGNVSTPYSFNSDLEAAAGGLITVTGSLNLSTVGDSSAGIRSNNALVNAQNVTIVNSGNAASGLWAVNGGKINVGLVDITMNKDPALAKTSYSYGILSDTNANSIVTLAGGIIREQDSGGSSNSAVRAINGGVVNSTGPLTITTVGTGARGIYASGGSQAGFADTTITTTGIMSNGFEVGKTADATGKGSGIINVDGKIDVDVSGSYSVALALQSPNSGSSSGFIATSGSSIKLRAASGGVIAYQGGINQTATLYNVDLATRSPSGTNSLISVGKNYQSTPLPGAAAQTTNAVLNLTNGQAVASTGGSLVDVTNSSSFTLNADNVTMTGSLTKDATSSSTLNLNNNSMLTLARRGASLASSFTALNLNSGSRLDASADTFTMTGNINNTAGVVNLVNAADAGKTLTIVGNLAQGPAAVLNVAANTAQPTQPQVTATTASLDGTLNIANLSLLVPATATALTNTTTRIMHTTGGITGDFAGISGSGGLVLPDYLVVNAGKTNGNMDYDLGLGLSWYADTARSHGNFTLPAAADTFTVDVALVNQPASTATGWDGWSLTKNGAGTLVLSVQNAYTGATTVNGGTLLLNTVNTIAQSDSVAVNGTLDMNGNDQKLQHLSGAGTGRIVLGGGSLTAYNNAGRDTAYAGAIVGAGQLIKTGAGELALSGTTAWSGQTAIQGGTLTLDGSNGGAQLVSDVFGQAGTSLKLINGAGLTGAIDPADVTVGPGSSWTMTADSITGNLTNAGTIVFVPPAAGSGFKTLTVQGTLDGTGALHMNTDLAALQGDLVVAHDTAGSHVVFIDNQGGEPTAPGQSLKIVDVSTPVLSNGSFRLNGDGLDVGAYRYNLLPGQQVAGGDPGDWYLTNTMEKSNLTNDVIAAANTAKYATTASLDNLHKRLGELRLDQGIEGDLWTRAYRKDYTTQVGSGIDQRIGGLEAGADHLFRFDGGRFYAGGLIGAGLADTSNNSTDSGESKSHQAGAYGTWIFDNGAYVDLIGRYFWFKRDYRTLPAGVAEYETGTSHSTALSLDTGPAGTLSSDRAGFWSRRPS